MSEADASDEMVDPGRLRQLELRVLEIDVVHDLGDRPERGIMEAEPLDENLERAAVSLVRVLRLEHVEARFTGLRPVSLARDELEARVGIDEAADEPGAGHPVDVNPLPGHPGPAADLLAHPARLRCDLFTARRGDQPRLDSPQESV